MKLYKYRPLGNCRFIQDIVLNERLHCAKYNDLNDPFEGLFFSIVHPRHLGLPSLFRQTPTVKCVGEMSSVINNRRICCLSSTLKEVRMWSHYADGHRGIAIEMEFPNVPPSVHEVTYVDYLPEYEEGLTFLTNLSGPTSDEILLFKTRHWEYEREYRVIQEEEYFSIAGCISTIYAGIRTSDDDLTLLRKLTSNEIPILKTRLDP